MGITFYIAKQTPEGMRRAFRCDCSERWCNACDVAWEKGEHAPDMYTCENCTDIEVDMNERNARDWMRWVGISTESIGEIRASELAALCRRRLWDEARNHDPALEGDEYKVENGPRVIMAERRPDYLRSQTERVLTVCEKAGELWIAWA